MKISFSIDEIESHGDYAFARTISRGEVTIRSEGVTLPEENRELFLDVVESLRSDLGQTSSD